MKTTNRCARSGNNNNVLHGDSSVELHFRDMFRHKQLSTGGFGDDFPQR